MNITNLNTQTNLLSNAARQPGTNALGKDSFLQMLVTQLRHQDPINPMDSAQFAAQLAQFNSVEQLINLNDKMEIMATQQELIGAGLSNTMSASLTGKTVKVRTSEYVLPEGTPPHIKYDLAGQASSVQIKIIDANGRVVRQQELRNVGPGEQSWAWNGRSDSGVVAPPGNYRIEVSATNEGTAVSSYAFSRGIADKIRFTPNGVQLQVNGIFVNLADVEEIGV